MMRPRYGTLQLQTKLTFKSNRSVWRSRLASNGQDQTQILTSHFSAQRSKRSSRLRSFLRLSISFKNPSINHLHLTNSAGKKMSFLEDSDLQIWNNAAFDSGDFEDSSGIKASFTPLKNMFTDASESINSDHGKENVIPARVVKQCPVPVKSSATPLQVKSASVKSQGKSVNVLEEEETRNERKIDAEIEAIRLEISRLSSRLDELCLEKVKRSGKMAEKRGRVVAAKFMEQKQGVKGAEEAKKIEEASSAKTKVNRRGVSLGPSDIFTGARRGMSLGPSEIAAVGKVRQLVKPEATPVPNQSRRKSCLWKLGDIDEGKVTKERGKSMTVSPRNRKIISKAANQAATTIASKRAVKKELGVVTSIQPKKLFTDGEKSIKKPLKNGRIVASRYSLIGNQSTGGCSSSLRKRSLPENEDEGKRCDKRRHSSLEKPGGTFQENGEKLEKGRVKKKWEIPSDAVVVHESLENDESPPSPQSITEMPDALPKIRTNRCIIESPRNSGPAKRVAELIGRKSFFCIDEDGEEHSVFLSLDFAEACTEEKISSE